MAKSDNGKTEGWNHWTVMVYLAGDNNLAEEMVYALKCMHFAGSRKGQYEVSALYDAGVGPVTMTFDDRNFLPAGVPPVGKFLEQAEQFRKEDEKKNVDIARKHLEDARKEEETIQEQIQTAEEDLLAAASNPASQDRHDSIEKLTKKVLQLERAKAFLKEVREVHESAKQAKRGGPEFVEPVEAVLKDFVVETIQKHPARNYMLVLSGHGSGAVGDFLSSNKRFFGLSIPGLKDVLEAVSKECKHLPQFIKGKIDILGLDSCLMGMAEVAFEVESYVEYLIGAEGFEPNTGWPYDVILNVLRNDDANVEADVLARRIVEGYFEYYSSDYTLADVSTDLSALHLIRIEHFAQALGGDEGGLSRLLKEALPLKDHEAASAEPENKRKSRAEALDAIVLAHWKAQGFKNEQHVDVLDLCRLLQERFDKSAAIWQRCQDVIGATEELVLAHSSCGPAFQYSNGVSIFFPWADLADAANFRDLDHYKELEFAKKTHWDEFLDAYLDATRRDPRNEADISKTVEHDSTLNRREGLFTGKPGKAGTVLSGKAGTVLSGKAGTVLSGKAGTVLSGKAGTVLSGKGDGGSKIASMKNPPIQWRDQYREKKGT